MPKESTVGAVGDIYTDSNDGSTYECTSIITVGDKEFYKWTPIQGGSESGGGSEGLNFYKEQLNNLLRGVITQYSDDDNIIKTIRHYAFYDCSELTSVNLPVNERIGRSAFSLCKKLISINSPMVTYIDVQAFNDCILLPNVDMPLLTAIGNQSFYNCMSLVTMNTPSLSSIGSSALGRCSKLVNITLAKSAITTSFGLASSSLLSDESIQNIIDSLADLTGGTTATLSLHSDVVQKLTDEQLLAIEAKNWAVS